MKKWIVWLLAAAMFAAPARMAWAVEFWVDALNGNDANSGLTALLPKKTIMGTSGVMAAGFATHAGDILNLSGTFRPLTDVTSTGSVAQAWKINSGAGHVLTNLTIKQWAGKPQAIIRGDIPVTLASGWSRVADGVFERTIAAGACTYWNDSGTHRTLIEGITTVVVDWDKTVDQYGRHGGHLRWVDSAATVTSTPNSWFFTPATPAASGGGGGVLRINFNDAALVDTAALAASGLTVAFCFGNVCPLEVGTPTYQTYPTWGAYDGTNVVNFMLDGIGFQLWADSGYRQNKPTGSGVGEDSSPYGGISCAASAANPTVITKVAHGLANGSTITVSGSTTTPTCDGSRVVTVTGADTFTIPVNVTNAGTINYLQGLVTGTVSTGYVRIADAWNSTIQNCWFQDNGYHGPTWAGDQCVGNTYRNCQVWGGAPNTNAAGTSFVFYTGPGLGVTNDITACRGYDCTAYLYTFLGRDGVPIPFPHIGTDAGTAAANGYVGAYDGYISHNDGRGLDAGTGAGGSANGDAVTTGELVTSNGGRMRTGELIYVVDTTATGIAAGQTISVTAASATTFTLTTNVATGAAVDITVAGQLHWYSLSNVTKDIEWRRCRTVLFSDTYANSLGAHSGQCMVGGNRAIAPSNPYEWRTYPIRFVDCEIVNGINNTTSLNDYCAYVRSRLSFDRAGSDGPYVGGSGRLAGGIIGSNSGTNTQGYFACEIVADLGSSAGNSKILSQMNTETVPNSLVFVNSSLYNNCDSSDHASNSQWFFYLTNGASSDVANRVSSRGSIFAHKWCNATTDSGGPTRGLVRNDRTGVGVTAMNFAGNMYANISTDSYIQFAGGTNNGPEANFTSNVDTAGVYLGQDPTPTNIALGQAMRNPFQEPGGQSLRLTQQAMQRTNAATVHVLMGFNQRRWSGKYGAWQDGSLYPQQVLSDRLLMH